jgi:hypothetical protein
MPCLCRGPHGADLRAAASDGSPRRARRCAEAAGAAAVRFVFEFVRAFDAARSQQPTRDLCPAGSSARAEQPALARLHPPRLQHPCKRATGRIHAAAAFCFCAALVPAADADARARTGPGPRGAAYAARALCRQPASGRPFDSVRSVAHVRARGLLAPAKLVSGALMGSLVWFGTAIDASCLR